MRKGDRQMQTGRYQQHRNKRQAEVGELMDVTGSQLCWGTLVIPAPEASPDYTKPSKNKVEKKTRDNSCLACSRPLTLFHIPFCCCVKVLQTKTDQGRKGFISPYTSKPIIDRSQDKNSGRRLKQKLWKNTAFWLDSLFMLS